MKKNKVLLVANWKMNPDTYEKADKLFQESVHVASQAKKVKTVLCIPYPWLTDFSHKHQKVVAFGGQDASIEQAGSFTGEVSPKMLTSSGVEYVIIGHSERRALGETDILIAQKVIASLKAGLKVILCLGEKSRDDHGEYLMFLREQIINSLGKIQKRYLKKLIIAYEPVWAIGGGDDEAMKPTDLHEISIFIKKILVEMYGQDSGTSIPILYGGSVSPDNAKDLINLGEVQGLLVGHLSLNSKKFSELLKNIE
ncbi:MAG: triose-phosphate isomerase family protein [Candidatus Paceibacterota bacterium]